VRNLTVYESLCRHWLSLAERRWLKVPLVWHLRTVWPGYPIYSGCHRVSSRWRLSPDVIRGSDLANSVISTQQFGIWPQLTILRLTGVKRCGRNYWALWMFSKRISPQSTVFVRSTGHPTCGDMSYTRCCERTKRSAWGWRENGMRAVLQKTRARMGMRTFKVAPLLHLLREHVGLGVGCRDENCACKVFET
jgi:hypothetical protein